MQEKVHYLVDCFITRTPDRHEYIIFGLHRLRDEDLLV